ncbi:MAG: hypothetical protein ACX93N_06705 [Pseudohaliea sp.]
MKESAFRALLGAMIDENPLAVRALLRIVSVEFTDTVPTLAVTVEERPRLLVNLAFIARHCANETQVKAVVLHEFLHVLLRHTERFTPGDIAQHLAFDAVINAIIHRSLGPDYSAMMAAYYADVAWPWKLLRPPLDEERYGGGPRHHLLAPWRDLYAGRLCADDIGALARQLKPRTRSPKRVLLGGHQRCEASRIAKASPALGEALDRALRAMNGHGIWRGPRRGVGPRARSLREAAASTARKRWRRQVRRILEQHLQPDLEGARSWVRTDDAQLPVLNASDRRAFSRALWSPLLPAVAWPSERQRPTGRAHVYLDVSGSMNAEMPELIALLNSLGRYIRRPFWAFSDKVSPALIRNGVLETDSSGGTTMACVLRHLARHRPPAAVVLTDGYIESLEPAQVKDACATARLHAIVTRNGSAQALRDAGIPYTQLGGLPQ